MSPDGTQIAASTCCSFTDRITIARVDGADATTMEALASKSQYSGRWSPDGRKIVYQERTGPDWADLGNVFVRDLTHGDVVQLTDITQRATTIPWWLSPVFSTDGPSWNQ